MHDIAASPSHFEGQPSFKSPRLWGPSVPPDDRTLRDKRVTEMIRLLRLRHAGAGYRLDAVRSHPGAARTLDHQAGPGPWKLPPSWSFATAQAARAAHDLVRPRSGRTANSTVTSQDLAQYGTVLQRLASVESETLDRQELKEMVHSPALAAFQAPHVTAWLERYIALDDELPCPPKGGVRVLSAEGLLVMGRAVELFEGQQSMTLATKSRGKGAMTRAVGVEGFSPSLASRLLYALGHGRYTWRGTSLEELDRLVSLLVPVAIGEGGEGLRRLTVQELVRLPKGLALLYPFRRRFGMASEPKFSEEMAHVEAECVRRGLDKFKAADLADLLEGFAGLRYEVDSALVDMVQERMMRRGYLTKGRGGQTDPRDAVRLLGAFSMTRPIRRLSDRSSFSTFVSHVLASKGLLESLQPRDLPDVIDVARRFHCDEIRDEALQRLIACEEEWAGRGGVDHYTIHRVFGCMISSKVGTWPQEAHDLIGRLVVRWADEVEAGECVLHDSEDYLRRLIACKRKGHLRGPDRKHAAQQLARGSADRFRLHREPWLTPPGYMARVLVLLHKSNLYPGQYMLDDVIEKFQAVAPSGLINPGRICDVTRALLWAVENHGYTPPPGFASSVVEWCKNARLTASSDVTSLCSAVKKLYESFLAKAPPEAYPSQAAVDGLLLHMGDPDKLLKRVCPGVAHQISPSLKAAVDLLKRNKAMATATLPQGPDRGAEDGHKKAEQPEGKATNRGPQIRLAEAGQKEGAQKGGGIEGITTLKQDMWGGSEGKGTTVGQDRAVEVLWGLIRKAQDSAPGEQPTVRQSVVVRGFSTPELECLIQGMASQEVDTEKWADRPEASAVVKEAMRPERLEGLRSHALVPLAICLEAMAKRGMRSSDRKALLGAWVDEVRMRGLPQVIKGPQDLASLFSALGSLGVKVEKGLVVSLLAELHSLGVQNCSPKQLGLIFDGLLRIPRSDVLYGEELQALRTKVSPQANPLLIHAMTRCIDEGLPPDAGLLSRAEEAIRATEPQVTLTTMLHYVYLFDVLDYTPGEATLQAVEHALLRGLPAGVAEQEPQEAMRDTALQSMRLEKRLRLARMLLKSQYRCDPRLWDYLAVALLPISIEPPVRRQRVAEFRKVLANRLCTPAVDQDPQVPVLQWLWNALNNQHLWGVQRGYLRALATRSWELDAFPDPGVVRELLGHWVAAVEGGTGDQEQGRPMALRDNLLNVLTADISKLVSRHSLSGSQVLEMVDPLQAHLEALCAGGSGPRVDPSTAIQALGCLESLSVVPRRRSSMEVLLAQGLARDFRSHSVLAILALVRGVAAHDIHPGEEAIVKLLAAGRHREWFLDQVVGQVTDMQDAIAQGRQLAWGQEGGGCGADGERFLRDLLEHCRRAQSRCRR